MSKQYLASQTSSTEEVTPENRQFIRIKGAKKRPSKIVEESRPKKELKQKIRHSMTFPSVSTTLLKKLAKRKTDVPSRISFSSSRASEEFNIFPLKTKKISFASKEMKKILIPQENIADDDCDTDDEQIAIATETIIEDLYEGMEYAKEEKLRKERMDKLKEKEEHHKKAMQDTLQEMLRMKAKRDLIEKLKSGSSSSIPPNPFISNQYLTKLR